MLRGRHLWRRSHLRSEGLDLGLGLCDDIVSTVDREQGMKELRVWILKIWGGLIERSHKVIVCSKTFPTPLLIQSLMDSFSADPNPIESYISLRTIAQEAPPRRNSKKTDPALLTSPLEGELSHMPSNPPSTIQEIDQYVNGLIKAIAKSSFFPEGHRLEAQLSLRDRKPCLLLNMRRGVTFITDLAIKSFTPPKRLFTAGHCEPSTSLIQVPSQTIPRQ